MYIGQTPKETFNTLKYNFNLYNKRGGIRKFISHYLTSSKISEKNNNKTRTFIFL